MKKLKKNKLLIRLVLVIVISILLGVFYMAIISKSDKLLVEDSLKLYLDSLDKLQYVKAYSNCLITNIILLVIIGVLGISIIGIPIIILLICYKGFILGFSISSILYFYKFKGIVFSFLFSIPLIIEVFIYLFLGYYAIIFSKNLNRFLFMKREINFKPIMRRYFKIFIFCLICLIISCSIEIFLVPNMLKVIIKRIL